MELARPLKAKVLPTLAALIAIGALAVSAWSAVSLGRRGYRALRAPSYQLRDNDIDPLAYFVSTEALALARRDIPAGASYTILVGNHPPVDVGAPLVPIIFRLWLAPRRFTTRLRGTRWVITYHRSPRAVPLDVVKRVRLGPSASLLEVAG